MRSSEYRFLGERRWVGLAALALAVAVACVFLGRWQLERHVSRAEANQLVNNNYDAQPVPLDALVRPGEVVDPSQVWRQVQVEGTYLGDQVMLRNRPVDGRPALRVLSPMALRSGGLVVVDRGWVDAGTPLTDIPEPPAGLIVMDGRLRQSESPGSRELPPHQVYEIDPASVLDQAGVNALDGSDVVDGYVLAYNEEPLAAQPLPQLPRPQTDPGSHLSYAFQWWVFAFVGPLGYIVLARREAADRCLDADGATADQGTSSPSRRTRRRSDAEEEDALIEAQVHRGV